ncbi:hypothetical protein BLA29_012082 [Euroglyphus maynei]|uniref:Uncharacterized protein n=1 Tax=Euroglyphus maynei TaxID=6958 RepID=A0A1Y3BRR5_EURMA|nr:hypothetical protein BLA29_012082 [Euroglyphus maynei]
MLISEQKQNYYYTELSSSPINITVNDCNQNGITNACLYNAWFRQSIDSKLTAGTIYECRIKLHGTFYVRKKRIKIIFPTKY